MDTGDPLVRVLPAKSQTWRGNKTNRQFEQKNPNKSKMNSKKKTQNHPFSCEAKVICEDYPSKIY